MVGEKYILAARDGAGATPFLIPALESPLSPDEILTAVDGLVFPGSPSNVSPERYGGQPPRAGNLADANRDATTMALIEAAVHEGVPALFICRGLQELNVALGGTLHQHVHELPGRLDHKGKARRTTAEKYALAHTVAIEPGGILEALLGRQDFAVNSLHAQAIDRLADGLRAEARAPDGTIEAVSMPGAKGFLLAVQWHPEWRWWDNAQSRILFEAFGTALREHRAARGHEETKR
jgi:putative glutamine amidotransferase